MSVKKYATKEEVEEIRREIRRMKVKLEEVYDATIIEKEKIIREMVRKIENLYLIVNGK